MYKKGILFTLIALLLSGMFIILYTTDVRTPLDYKVDLYTMKAQNIRNYEDNLEQYATYALEISGYQALTTLIGYEQSTSIPYDSETNLSCALADVVLDGVLSNRTTTDAGSGSNTYLFGAMDLTDGSIIYENLGGLMPSYFLLQNQSHVIYNYDINRTNSLIIRFKPGAGNKGIVKSLNISIQNTYDVPRDATVNITIYSTRCNTTIFPLDIATKAIPAGASGIVSFPFTKSAYVDQEEYFIEISSNQTLHIRYNTDSDPDVYNNTMYAVVWHNYTNDDLVKKQSLTNYLEALFQLSEKTLAIDANFTLFNLNISHSSAWELNITGDFLFIVTDNQTIYDKHKELSSAISIVGLPEPLLALNMKKSRPIKKAPFDVDLRWNLSIFTNFTMENYTWGRYNETPSFLYRMMNRTDPSGNYGIESVLPNHFFVGNKTNISYVDWLFINNTYDHCSNIMRINYTYMRELNALHPGIFIDRYSDFWETNNGTTLDWQTLSLYQVNNTFFNLTCTT